MPVVMAGIHTQHLFELPAAEDQQPIETLATYAADPALGVCVGVRRLDRCADHDDPFALEDVIETAAELGVAVVNQEASCLLAVVEGHQQVARLLGCSSRRRVACAGDELDSTCLEREEEEHVDPFQSGGLDGEEITGERRRRVLAEEVSPGELVSLRRGRQSVADEDRPDRGRRYGDAKAVQFTDDPLVAPTRILACEPNNQRLHATIERWPPRPPVRVCPAAPD